MYIMFQEAVRTFKSLLGVIADVYIRIPLRILKRLAGHDARPMGVGDFCYDIFKVWVMLVVFTALSMPSALKTALAYIILLVFIEAIYVLAAKAKDFWIAC